jgi:hypothetical protein
LIFAFDYASPSVFESDRDRALLGMSANARRPVRFHARVVRNVPLLRFALRALGEAVWSNDAWLSEGEFTSWTLDPVITVHPDRIFFEAFSQDQSVYVMLIARPEMFAIEGGLVTGTTNVDFTAGLWGALNELRSSRETWLRVGAEGFEVKTKSAGGRFEQKVELPDSWVRGFLKVSGAMAMPGTRLTAKPADLLAAIRFLRYSKARMSPRALRYEFVPGEDARLVLEPWEQVVTLRGAEHHYAEPRVVRTWGRRRLKLIEPLLPFATGVDVYLKGRGLPSFYVVKLPDVTLVLGLSGWSEQSWTDAGGFELLETRVDESLTSLVQQVLASSLHATPPMLAATLQQRPEAVWRACERLCRQGRAVFDVESRGFRHRELFEEPVDETKLFPPDARMERARELLDQKAVSLTSCEPQENRKSRRFRNPADGALMVREIIHRDWRVTGAVGGQQTEIVVSDSGRVIFGTCGCPFFQDNLLGRGPCEHMIALFHSSNELRTDLPTSQAASGHVSPTRNRANRGGEEDEDGAADDSEDDQEDFDESESDDENERR